MAGFQKILAAIDGSEPSYRAARSAADLAVRFGARLVLVTVIPPLLLPPDAYGIHQDDIEKEHHLHAKKLLSDAVRHLEEPGVETETVILEGSPAEEIVSLAKDAHADLVVLGSRGRNAAARVLLGSVSDRVVHQAHSPVLVVR